MTAPQHSTERAQHPARLRLIQKLHDKHVQAAQDLEIAEYRYRREALWPVLRRYLPQWIQALSGYKAWIIEETPLQCFHLELSNRTTLDVTFEDAEFFLKFVTLKDAV